MPISHVSDTAHWVAMYRALESERPDALFDDPYARRMAGELGSSIIREIPHGASMAWAVVVRTVVVDEIVLTCIKNGATRVLNLGAGLDTRAFRLGLPPSVRWFDVDLPRVVKHRRACLKDLQPRCRHTHIIADITDASALHHTLKEASLGDGQILVVTEGLLVYLKPVQVEVLAKSLNAVKTARWWLTDLVSPMLLGMVGAKWPTNEAAVSAPFLFAPRDSARFFAPLGWRETFFRSTLDEAVRLERAPPMAHWWSTFTAPWWPGARENMRRMSGILLMESASLSRSAAEALQPTEVPP